MWFVLCCFCFLLKMFVTGQMSPRRFGRALMMLCFSREFREALRRQLQPPRVLRALPPPPIKPLRAKVLSTQWLQLPIVLVGKAPGLVNPTEAKQIADRIASLPIVTATGRVFVRLLQTAIPNASECDRLAKLFGWREATPEEVAILLAQWPTFCPDGNIVLPGARINTYDPGRSVVVFRPDASGRVVYRGRLISSGRATTVKLETVRGPSPEDVRHLVFCKQGDRVLRLSCWSDARYHPEAAYFLPFVEVQESQS